MFVRLNNLAINYELLNSHMANLSLILKQIFFFLLIPKQPTYFNVQQMVLLVFSCHLVPRLGFELTSVDLHQDPAPFEGCSTN